MRGLSRGVDHQLDGRRVFIEQAFHGGASANVGVQGAVSRIGGAQPVPLPGRGCFRPEELAAHVVVDADDIVSLFAKMRHGLRAN